MSFPQWQPGQANPEVPVNEALDLFKFMTVYAYDPEVSDGLTWGYLGGRWGEHVIADNTLSLIPSATNYIVVERSTGNISVSSSDTNWNDTTNYARTYKLTTNSFNITSEPEDHRIGASGILGPRTTVVTGLPVGNDGDYLQYDEGAGEWVAAAGGGGGGGGGPTILTFALTGESEQPTAGLFKYRFMIPFTFTLSKIKVSLNGSPFGGAFSVNVRIRETPGDVPSTILSSSISIAEGQYVAEATDFVTPVLTENYQIVIDYSFSGYDIGGGLKIFFIGET